MAAAQQPRDEERGAAKAPVGGHTAPPAGKVPGLTERIDDGQYYNGQDNGSAHPHTSERRRSERPSTRHDGSTCWDQINA